MIIEMLYSNVAGMYGDNYNISFLANSNADIKVIYTELNDEPYFVNNDVDMIYMGSMMERYQPIVVDRLRKYTSRIKELIENETIFLITGNALEIFGECIDDQKCLGIFDFKSNRDFSHHHNSCYLGKFNDMDIVGFKSCFSYSYKNNLPLFTTVKGYGFKDDNSIEGVKYKNFFGTYLIGPLLILNPDFTHYLLKLKNSDCKLQYEKEIYDAYLARVKEYKEYQDFKEFKH